MSRRPRSTPLSHTPGSAGRGTTHPTDDDSATARIQAMTSSASTSRPYAVLSADSSPGADWARAHRAGGRAAGSARASCRRSPVRHQGGHHHRSARRTCHVPRLDDEHLPLVGDSPQLGASHIDQPVVGDEPLLVQRPVQHPDRCGTPPVLPDESASAGGLARQLADGTVRRTHPGAPEQRVALAGPGSHKNIPPRPEGGSIRGHHPVAPQPQRRRAPGHQLIEHRHADILPLTMGPYRGEW